MSLISLSFQTTIYLYKVEYQDLGCNTDAVGKHCLFLSLFTSVSAVLNTITARVSLTYNLTSLFIRTMCRNASIKCVVNGAK